VTPERKLAGLQKPGAGATTASTAEEQPLSESPFSQNWLLLDASRYANARQVKRAKASTRKLRTRLGRVLGEIEH
jgi:hypothetical protein